MSLGSGFIINSSGIIVTNKHVIANAYEITVTLDENTPFADDGDGRVSV